MKFTKHDDAKPRLDLLPPLAIEIVGYVLRHGALTYAPNNWRKCKDPARYVAPILRHTFKHLSGEYTDKDSGLLHLAHAICSGLFALELFAKQEQTPGMFTKQFSYFALVERKSKRRGIVKKRFRSFEKAWKYLTGEGLDPSSYLVTTVQPKTKVGSVITL